MSEVQMQYDGKGDLGPVSFTYDSETGKILQIADMRVENDGKNENYSLIDMVRYKNNKRYYDYILKYSMVLNNYGFNGKDIEEQFNDAILKLSAYVKNESSSSTSFNSNSKSSNSDSEEQQDNRSDIEAIHNKLDDLYSKLSRNNINSIYIYLKFGDLEIKTNIDQSYVASIEYNRTGTDENQGSSLSINIIYRCSNMNGTVINNMNFESNPDPNTLELAILNAMFKETVCKFQYGYSYPDLIVSPMYNILVTDCTCEIQNKYLIYTITAYSLALSIKDDSLSKIDGDTTEISYTNNETPTEVVERLIDMYNKNNKNEKKINVTWVSYSATQRTVKSSDRNFTDSSEGVDVDDSGHKKQGLVGKYTHKFEDNTIFQEINYFLQKAVHKSDDVKDVEKPQCNKYKYGFKINDTSENNKEIDLEIYLTDTIANSSSDSVSIYTYNMLDVDDSIVLDFKTDYHGAYLKEAIDKNLLELDTHTENKLYVLDPKSIRNNGVVTRDAIEANNRNIVKAISNAAYNATLQIVGTPINIPLLSVIKVVPIINGLKHHSEGFYQVTKITDTLDTSGYKTTLGLLRLANNDEKQYENLVSLLSGDLKNYLDKGIFAYKDPEEEVKKLYQDELEEQTNQNKVLDSSDMKKTFNKLSVADMNNNSNKTTASNNPKFDKWGLNNSLTNKNK